jgi:hypothetical protein
MEPGRPGCLGLPDGPLLQECLRTLPGILHLFIGWRRVDIDFRGINLFRAFLSVMSHAVLIYPFTDFSLGRAGQHQGAYAKCDYLELRCEPGNPHDNISRKPGSSYSKHAPSAAERNDEDHVYLNLSWLGLPFSMSQRAAETTKRVLPAHAILL